MAKTVLKQAEGKKARTKETLVATDQGQILADSLKKMEADIPSEEAQADPKGETSPGSNNSIPATSEFVFTEKNPSWAPHGVISIKGARTHNLKNISLDIPRHRFVVITGVSGSGKSSLAFDTIYAEGQRRYIESLSAYARQFLHMMDKPDIDAITGLSPAISIDQKTRSQNPRSTVGTVTEIYDYMRLLFARIGVPYSPTTGLPIEAQTIDQMADRIATIEGGTKLLILAPVVRDRKGEFRAELQRYLKQGFQRILVDGKIYAIDAVPALNRNDKHTLALVVDRLIVPTEAAPMEAWKTRLRTSLETTVKMSEGIVWVHKADAEGTPLMILSEKFACPVSGFTLDAIEPRLFSFNNPQGACPQCNGLGSISKFDPHLVINWSLSIKQGAIECLTDSARSIYRLRHIRVYYEKLLEALAKQFHFSVLLPFKDLPESAQHLILYGTGETPVPLTIKGSRGKEFKFNKPFEGVLNILTRRFMEADNESLHEVLAPMQRTCPCPTCQGARLKPEALCVKVGGKSITEVSDLSVVDALAWFADLKLTPKQQTIAEKIIKEITTRLHFLQDVGLDYLTLSRSSNTLSGGESQRIRLASQIGSGLTGVLYVLDEPSIGLHQRDNDRLLRTIKHLRDLDNTVIVVEHDEDAMREADWIVDIGPHAGIYGGKVMAQGPLETILKAEDSLTADYLSGRRQIQLPTQRRPILLGESSTKRKAVGAARMLSSVGRLRRGGEAFDNLDWRGRGTKSENWGRVNWLKMTGARSHNLKDVTVEIPLGRFVCVTGVSGSGKSSLILESLTKSLQSAFQGKTPDTSLCDRLKGIEHVDKLIDIDQTPIGRTPRSNPATYIGCFTAIREWFANLPESKARGYSAGRFSFNVKGGRCEACQGDGVTKIEMHFLSDVYVQCDQCHGKRYNQETLSVRYKDKNIADVLSMSIDEGVTFFENHAQIWNKLKKLQEVGLGYLSIGHPATLLSGGEAQRVKLAKELCRRATGQTLYILDEPTTGLHFEDVRKLIEVLNKLVDQGNTVLVIEHNLEVIKVADWIIDMGPEGGDKGGRVIVTGTPEQVAAFDKSYTGQYLRPYLKRKG